MSNKSWWKNKNYILSRLPLGEGNMSMGLRVANLFKSMFNVAPHERLKLLLLSITFFFVIASYTIIKELKDSIFVAVVGNGYIPYAKTLTMLVLVPAILFYSFLVDRLRRYHLVVCLCNLLRSFRPRVRSAFRPFNYWISKFRCQSKSNWFGWLFYFFVEGILAFHGECFSGHLLTPLLIHRKQSKIMV